MEQQKELFSNKDLKAMIVPLFLEQLLVMLVGMADTLVVSYAGEAAVSGVSLVNGGFGRRIHGACIYYRDRAVHGE